MGVLMIGQCKNRLHEGALASRMSGGGREKIGRK